MGFGVSLMFVLQLCNRLTCSFNQRLHNSKLCKPAFTLAPSTCDPLLLTDLSKMKTAPLGRLDKCLPGMAQV